MIRIAWVLGIDVGQKKTGIAIGQSVTGTANPLACLRISSRALTIQHFMPVVKEWSVTQVLIGLPTQMDGKSHPLAKDIHRLGAAFICAGLPVYYADETLTSHAARQRFPNRSEWDSAAAAIMVEDYFAVKFRENSEC